MNEREKQRETRRNETEKFYWNYLYHHVFQYLYIYIFIYKSMQWIPFIHFCVLPPPQSYRVCVNVLVLDIYSLFSQSHSFTRACTPFLNNRTKQHARLPFNFIQHEKLWMVSIMVQSRSAGAVFRAVVVDFQFKYVYNRYGQQ